MLTCFKMLITLRMTTCNVILIQYVAIFLGFQLLLLADYIETIHELNSCPIFIGLTPLHCAVVAHNTIVQQLQMYQQNCSPATDELLMKNKAMVDTVKALLQMGASVEEKVSYLVQSFIGLFFFIFSLNLWPLWTSKRITCIYRAVIQFGIFEARETCIQIASSAIPSISALSPSLLSHCKHLF